MKKYFTLGLLFLFLTSSSQNPLGEIRGTLVDSISKEPIPNAYVFVLTGSDSIANSTDLDGKFVFKGIKAGVYQVKVSCIGYQTRVIKQVQVFANQVKFLGVIPMIFGIELSGVVYSEDGGRKLLDPDEPSAMVIISSEILKSPNQRELMKLVGTVVPGVMTSDDGKEVHFRGAREGAEAYYIDGVKVQSINGYPSQAIGSIKVYTCGIPAQYGDLTGGVIAIETKSYFDLYNTWLASHPEGY